MYGIINVVERNLMDYSEKHITIIDINETKLIYSNNDINEFKKKLADLLKYRQYNKLLIFEVNDNIDIKLIGYKQVFYFPHYQINKTNRWRNMITEIINDNDNIKSEQLLNKTLYSIKGILSYLKIIDRVKKWSKRQLKKEFANIGYKKTVWYRIKYNLRESYLEKYYLHILAEV